MSLAEIKKEFIIDTPIPREVLIQKTKKLLKKGVRVKIDSEGNLNEVIFLKNVVDKEKLRKQAVFVFNEINSGKYSQKLEKKKKRFIEVKE